MNLNSLFKNQFDSAYSYLIYWTSSPYKNQTKPIPTGLS